MRYITGSIFIWWILLLETVRMFLIDELFVDFFLKAFELLMKLLKSQIDAGTPREGMDSLTSRNFSGGKEEVHI